MNHHLPKISISHTSNRPKSLENLSQSTHIPALSPSRRPSSHQPTRKSSLLAADLGQNRPRSRSLCLQETSIGCRRESGVGSLIVSSRTSSISQPRNRQRWISSETNILIIRTVIIVLAMSFITFILWFYVKVNVNKN